MRSFNPRNMRYDTIFGIAIRLPFSYRDQKNSSYNDFFTKTLQKDSSKTETIFPTKLQIQTKYRNLLNRAMFFTPDLSSVYEGYILNIYGRDDFKENPNLCLELAEINPSFSSKTKQGECFMYNWIVMTDLKEIMPKDMPELDYYVLNTNYPLFEKMREPDFPRIYFTNNKGDNRFVDLKYYSFCPYCGKKMPGESFFYCPYCGSSLRIKEG